jgi:hypothetical protein
MALPPVDHTVNVPLEPREAFELFTTQIRKWWPFSSHSCAGDKARDVVFEPRVGGRVAEHAEDGTQHPWGTLLEWDPPRSLAMRWHPGQPENQATLLKVTFTGRARSTDVRILHEGWEARGDGAAQVRGEYEKGWPLVLARLVAAAT